VDPITLSTGVSSILAPWIPYLVKGIDIADKILVAKEITEVTASGLKKLWSILCPKLEERSAGTEAIEAVVIGSPEAETELRLQIRKILERDQALADEVASLYEEIWANQGTTVIVQAIGDRSIAAGRDVNIGELNMGNTH
jgi:hypothetical protein